MMRHAATVLAPNTSKTVAATAVRFRWLPVLLLVCLLSQVLLPHMARLKRRSVRSGARQRNVRDKSAESTTTETGAMTATMTAGGETTNAAADHQTNAASLSAVRLCRHLRHLSPHLLLHLLPHTHTQMLPNLRDPSPAIVHTPTRKPRHQSLLVRPRQREVKPKGLATMSTVIRSAVVRSSCLHPQQLILTRTTVAALHKPRRRQNKAVVLPPTDMIAIRTVRVTDADAATATAQDLDLGVEMSVVNALHHPSLKLWPVSTTLIRPRSWILLTSSTPTPQVRACRSSCLARTSRLL
jgi:hypothetical protein